MTHHAGKGGVYPVGTEWMSRYRPLVAALVKHTNVVQRAAGRTVRLSEEVSLSTQEWQVFEYILEHQDDDSCMNHISERLGIAQSTFSKITKYLCEQGLVDKYQTETNRKNIILRPSADGVDLYRQQTATVGREMFGAFFEDLDGLSDEQLETFTAALERLNATLSQGGGAPEKPRLIKKL